MKHHARRLPLLGTLLLAPLLLGACDGGPTDPPPIEETGTVTLPILGLGAVPERFTSEVAVLGDWAYTGTWSGPSRQVGNALKIWNVAGPTPVLHGTILVDSAQTLGDVHISAPDRLMVVATEHFPGSIILYDLSDPGAPRRLSRFHGESLGPGVHTAKLARVNGTLYVFASVARNGGRLIIIDVSDPSRPREVFSAQAGNPFIHDVFVRDGILFTALWNEGVAMWDLGGAGTGGSPAAPRRMGTVDVKQSHNVYWSGAAGGRISNRYVFIGQERPGALAFSLDSAGDVHVVDILNPQNPRVVAVYSVPSAGTHNFSVDEASGILYAAYYNGGVRAIDVSGDLSACTDQQRDALGRCDLRLMGRERGVALLDFGQRVYTWGVQWVDGTLYASDMLHGLFKIDARQLR